MFFIFLQHRSHILVDAMISKIAIENFGAIPNLSFDGFQNINLLIGPNQCGKTTMLKAIYSALRTTERHGRGKEYRTEKELLPESLIWTFQCSPLGGLVRKGTGRLSFSMVSSRDEVFSYSFGPSTEKSITDLINTFPPTDTNTVFIPAKETLSLREIILDSRNRYSEFGFEDPYFDLAKALTPTVKGRNYKAFSDARQSLENMIGGKLNYVPEKKEWIFRDNQRREYEVYMASEGVKKLSILELLLGNHYLSNESVILIDEIEANLHPALISKLLEIVIMLAQAGVQFFIASHSYFVIKRLYILAHQNRMSVPVISFDNGVIQIGDLGRNMPRNSIIDESINIYRDEVNL